MPTSHNYDASVHLQKRSRWRLICIVLVCTSAMIVNIANSAAVAILLPAISSELDVEPANLQWVQSAYSLSSGCFLLLFGRLADLYGRKRVFLLGFTVIGAFALGVGFAPNQIGLDLLRAIQGLGGAAVVPAALGILAHTFPPSRARSIAFSTFAAGAPLGGAFGYVFGGVLVQLTDPTWRSAFYLYTGLCGLSIVVGYFTIDPDQPSQELDRRVDWIGAGLVTTGLVLIIFVLSDSPSAPQEWRTPYIIALLIVGFIFILLFLAWQRFLERLRASLGLDLHPDPSIQNTHGFIPEPSKLSSDAEAHLKSLRSKWWAAPPLMKLSMWKRANGRFAAMQFIACLNWCSFVCWSYWVQLYYQNYMGLTPINSMVRILPTSIVGVLCNVVMAMIVGHVPLVWLIASGTMLTGCANVFFAAIDPSLPYWALQFPSALIIVVGADFVFAAGTLFIAKICLPHEQSVGGAIFQTMTQIGSTFGLSISTIVYNAIVRSKAAKLGVEVTGSTSDSDIPKAALLGGYKGAHWTAFAFGIAGTVMGILFLRGVGIVGHKKTKLRDRTAEEGVDAEGKQTPQSEQHTREREHDKAIEETLSSSVVQEKTTA
ncbi:MFS general substrate transporter [Stereum hirsutum FP-91666 SS1]|uniref:MFS general substrate transporter n=1 Tax=Stereum hirsutum (strain FP-91666) TaxID=721885 RepID=R7RYP7_STEHR|nr:MFS general substrate transporter [Stereum hirsutum FP-91666 SS1]EIM80449.1 MFS general substrate transporter [Stereum hirsutum FP-91666 SS1]